MWQVIYIYWYKVFQVGEMTEKLHFYVDTENKDFKHRHACKCVCPNYKLYVNHECEEIDRFADIFETIKNLGNSLSNKGKIIIIILVGRGWVGGREGEHM